MAHVRVPGASTLSGGWRSPNGHGLHAMLGGIPADSKFTRNCKGQNLVKTTPKKKDELESLTLPDFKTYYEATAIKPTRFWCKSRQTDQWTRTRALTVTRTSMASDPDGATRPYGGERMSFSTNGAGTNGIVSYKRMKLKPNLTLLQKLIQNAPMTEEQNYQILRRKHGSKFSQP